MVAVAKKWRLTPGAEVAWGAPYALVPVASFDVRYRRVRWSGKFGEWSTLLSTSTKTATTVVTTPGYTYCFAVRARRPERCGLALDQPGLEYRPGRLHGDASR